MTTNGMHCATFDERLADYLEDDLAPGERRGMEAHLASCVRCAAVVRDVEHIRAEAAALPTLAPSADLWDGIAARIATPVVPLDAPAAPNAPRRRRWSDRARLAAVAAALVAVTAGVTYTLTMSRVRAPERVGTVAQTNPSQAPSAGVAVPGDTPSPAPDAVTPAGGAQVASRAPSPERMRDAVDGRAPAASTQPVRNASPAATYSREIDRLRTIFTQHRQQLDPRTAAIIEANLKVIDEAIAQSRAALAQDPANRFLDERLNSALDKKLELLRTAALLSNRTT